MLKNRKVTSMNQAMKEIQPYLHKKVFRGTFIYDYDIGIIAKTLLVKYKNVELIQGVENNHLYLKIRITKDRNYTEQTLEVIRSEVRTL